MVAINDAVNGIFADIDTQSSITTEFMQVDSIAASYDKLSDNCMATGTISIRLADILILQEVICSGHSLMLQHRI
ncbi:MAG: hypothetical protein ACLT33_06220 [Lachnospira pectinoschiza]